MYYTADSNNNKKKFSAKDYWENRLNENFGLNGVGYIGLGKNYNHWLYKIKNFLDSSSI
jgi:hypothetical protein